MTEPVDPGILEEFLGYHLRRAQSTVFDDFMKTISSNGVTPGQFGLLILIEQNPGLNQSALARTVGIERSTMVAVIKGLEGRGLIQRRAGLNDKRSYALTVTKSGAKLLKEIKPKVRNHEKRIARSLDDEEKETLVALLRKLHSDD